jgi:hypothetical protein
MSMILADDSFQIGIHLRSSVAKIRFTTPENVSFGICDYILRFSMLLPF